ncbi:MAG: hypothetical protein ACJAS4_000366 [Bacteriovoracaceae bacterium]|jgi:hypothetical protein
MKKFKRLAFITLILVAYSSGLFIKNIQKEKRALRNVPTMPKIRQEKGIPIFAKKITKQKFKKKVIISGFLQKNGVLKSFVTPQEKNLLRVGMIGDFELGKKKYKGAIRYISNDSSVLSGLHEMHLNFENIPPEAIRQLIIVSVTYKTISNKIVLPRELVSLRTGSPITFEVTKDLKINKRKVIIEQENDTFFVISHGIQEGDTVVSSDPRDLRENDKVFIAKEVN